MIVHSVRARDVLKYADLQLQGLPDRGLLVVTGPNESGKSTVGEILALALFGRTHSLDPSHLDKAIRWDARAGSVEVAFSTSIAGRSRVVREIDRDGKRSATLHTPEGAEIRGWDGVNAAVEELLGFGFPEYLESFYLARREPTSAAARAETLRAMAGVLPLEQIARELGAEVPRLERKSLKFADQLLEVDEKLGRYTREDLLPPQPGPARGDSELVAEVAERRRQLQRARSGFDRQLPELEVATRELVGRAEGATRADWTKSVERMEGALDALEESVSFLGYDDVESGTGRLSHMLERVAEGLTAFDGLVAASAGRRSELAQLLGQEPAREIDRTFDEQQEDIDADKRAARARRKKQGTFATLTAVAAVGCGVAGLLPIDGLTPQVSLGLKIGGGVLLAAAIFLFTKRGGIDKELRRLGQQDADLADRRESAEEDIALLDGLGESKLNEAAEALEGLRGLGSLQAAVRAFRDGAGGRLTKPGTKERLETGALDQLAVVNAHLGQLGDRIGSDVESLGKIHELRAARASLASKRSEAATQLEVRELARELAEDAARHIAFEFNGRVKQALGRILPGLTEGRYQYLQIDDDLSVRVFSSTKQDFVDFEEISGGTQRQIALATRLALSETLADRADRGPQFVFLDEPFAYFDAARTKSTLAAMPRLSERLPQIWIATQEPPDGVTADVSLRCSTGSARLATS